MINRASSGYMLEIGDEVLLLDHGGGAHDNLLRTGRRATEVNTLFLSHLHTDHCLDYARLVHSRWDQGAGRIPDLTVHAPKEAERMTELLFGEDGVYRVDLNGRMNSTGSRVVYENRGGVARRRAPFGRFHRSATLNGPTVLFSRKSTGIGRAKRQQMPASNAAFPELCRDFLDLMPARYTLAGGWSLNPSVQKGIWGWGY